MLNSFHFSTFHKLSTFYTPDPMRILNELRTIVDQLAVYATCLILAPSLIAAQPLHQQLAAYQTPLQAEFSEENALATVAHLQRFWRENGNAHFNACMDHLAEQLKNAGFTDRSHRYQLWIHDTLLTQQQSWQPYEASVRILEPVDTLMYSLTDTPMALCVGSHATPPEGVTAELVFIDTLNHIPEGALAGKIAYTHRPPSAVFPKAIVTGKAVGIISSYVPELNRPERNRDLVSMSKLPRNREAPVFGFKISRRWQQTLDSLLARERVVVRARVNTAFHPKQVREVTAVIRGTKRPEEVIALVAHVDEPGANDNASGSAALLEIALSLKRLIDNGALPLPARSLRFMWVEEIASIRRWRRARPEEFRQVRAALVLDMVGQDVRKTGGRFLIEKAPDPSAIWTRPPDAHTAWGKGFMPRSWIRGTYLNDLMIAACESVAQREPWNFAANPFEGGSDHVPFLSAGIPAVLAWHFTDQFYHTSGDNLDKVSAAEMRRVAVAVASVALFIANTSEQQAIRLLEWLQERAGRRLENEFHHSRTAIQRASDFEDERQKQVEILNAWRDWYVEAFESVAELPITRKNPRLKARISTAKQRLDRDFEFITQGLHHDSQKAPTH